MRDVLKISVEQSHIKHEAPLAKAILDRFHLRAAQTMLWKWGVLVLMDDGGNGRVPQRVTIQTPAVFNAVRDALLGKPVAPMEFEIDLNNAWVADPGLRLPVGATNALAILPRDKAKDLGWLNQVFIEEGTV